MAQGQDPAIGAGPAKVAQVQPRKVLVRKVVVTKRIVVVKPAQPSAAAPASGQASAPAARRADLRRARPRAPGPGARARAGPRTRRHGDLLSTVSQETHRNPKALTQNPPVDQDTR